MTAIVVAESRRGECDSRRVWHRSTAPPTQLYRRFFGPAEFVAIVKLIVFASTVRTA